MAAQTMRIEVEGMSCASCVGRVERALAAVPGVRDASVNLATQSASMMLDGATPAQAAEALEAAGYPAVTRRVTLQVAEMTCASCTGRVERVLTALPGVIEASVNLATLTAGVTYLAGAVTPEAMAGAVTDAGYPAATDRAQAKDEDRHAGEARILAQQVVIAGLLTLPVFALEMGSHFVPGVREMIDATIGLRTSWLIQFALVTAVLLWPGRRFFLTGIPALLKGAPEMNSLVALGTAAAWGYSVVALYLPGLLPQGAQGVYFEAAGVIVTLILLGRWLEARAKGRTGAAIRSLMGLRPRTARVERDGESVEVALEEIATGDVVQVRPGERLAVDGTVLTGGSWIDESMITGEARPVQKAVDDAVIGGTVNGTGVLRIRAGAVGADTVLAGIVRMVEEAQGAKLPIQAAADRVVRWFVPAVLVLAAATVAVWLGVGPAPALSHALVAGVSVLIVACPCAMGLATPVSVMVGTGRAAELGVLFRKGDALQSLSAVSVIAFDKTGTLTMGRPELTDFRVVAGQEEDSILTRIAALEASSEHPLASAILRAADARGLGLQHAERVEAFAGLGLSGTVGASNVLVGADRLMQREGLGLGGLEAAGTAFAAAGRSPVYAAIDGAVVAVMGIADPVKPSSRAVVAALKAQGLRVAMITGDNAATADAVARDLGIGDVVAEVMPDGKVAALAKLRRAGETLAFVGDGINDAPALAAADVGIAVGTGTDVAMETADVVLMSGDLAGVGRALEISRATLRNIRQNLFWAFAYNTALIPVAAGVLWPVTGTLLSPMLAAGAMALSSVFVVTNALRLRRVGAVVRPSTGVADSRVTAIRGEAA